jgi:hypothetical protein
MSKREENHDGKQAGSLNVILVANCKTERDFELPTSEFKHNFCIRHQYQCEDEPLSKPNLSVFDTFSEPQVLYF